MKLIFQQMAPTIRGSARSKVLAVDAAMSLMAVEKDTDKLVYTEMYRDPVASLLARRTNKNTSLPGYSGHNFGLSVDLDVKTILAEKKIRYEDLLRLLKKRGWYCHRRDGQQDQPESNHFNFLGDHQEKCLLKVTQDPTTWEYPIETRILDLFGSEFQLTIEDVQELLQKALLYWGPRSDNKDSYTREAILAFQRAWDLVQTGSNDIALCRALALVTAEVSIIPLPAWAV